MKLSIVKLTAGLSLACVCVSTAVAQQITEFRDGYVTRSETVWTTRVVSEPTTTMTCSGSHTASDISLGDLVVSGLVGSAIGNKFSDRHGAGTLGAVAGVFAMSNNKQRRNCVRETTYTNHTERYPSHYVIHVRAGAQRLQFESAHSYQRNERVRVRVFSDYSVVH